MIWNMLNKSSWPFRRGNSIRRKEGLPENPHIFVVANRLVEDDLLWTQNIMLVEY